MCYLLEYNCYGDVVKIIRYRKSAMEMVERQTDAMRGCD